MLVTRLDRLARSTRDLLNILALVNYQPPHVQDGKKVNTNCEREASPARKAAQAFRRLWVASIRDCSRSGFNTFPLNSSSDIV